MIHNSSIVDKKAKIAKNVKIGPFCYVGPNVELSEGVELISNVHIEGNTKIGKNTKIFPFASLGTQPQDLCIVLRMQRGGESASFVQRGKTASGGKHCW